MKYGDALSFIHSLGRGYGTATHDRMRILLFLLSDPQKQLRCVHITGTNGKGSVTAYLSALFAHAGYRTGSFTSPFITQFRERIQLDGKMIPKGELAALVDEIRPVVERMTQQGEAPTQFEFVTALALLWFARKKCQLVLLEAGIGGLLDATNCIPKPLAVVVTSIGYDHTAQLGSSLEQITLQKCGLIHDGCAVICAPGQDATVLGVIQNQCETKNSHLFVPELEQSLICCQSLKGTTLTYKGLNFFVPLLGDHQILNVLTAVETAFLLGQQGFPITEIQATQGVAKARLPARMELLRQDPVVIVDGGHNPAGLAALQQSLVTLGLRRITAVVGMLADKDCTAALEQIAPYMGRAIAVAPSNLRALPAEDMAKVLGRFCPCDVADSIEHALRLALQDPCDGVVVFGSLFLAAEARQLLLTRKKTAAEGEKA